MKYVIDSKVYENHINDEVHLYGLLHQIAFLAEKAKDEKDLENLAETAKRYGEIAEEKFAAWRIPGRYLVFGDRKDLAELKAVELTPLTAVLKEHDAKIREKQRAATADDPAYIISGSASVCWWAISLTCWRSTDISAIVFWMWKQSGSLRGYKRISPASIRRSAGCTAGGASRTARVSRASICWKVPSAGHT